MTLACEKDVRLLTEFLLMKMTLLENQPHFRSACCTVIVPSDENESFGSIMYIASVSM